MKKTLNVLFVVLVACALTAWGLTTVTGQRIINSTLDSTPIGSTTPSTGSFTNVQANSASFGTLQAGGSASTALQGANLGWNVTGGVGESDFVNSKGSGAGGWWFFNAPTGGNILPSHVATIDGAGNFTGTSFNGNLNGTATYATSAGSAGTANTANSANSANVLNSPVYNCGATIPATGIQTDGNANCGAYPFSAASNGFVTLPGGIIMQWGQTGTYDTGPVATNLAHTFPHACLNATVGSLYQGSSRISSFVSCSTTSITTQNDGSGVTTFIVIGY